MKRNQIIIAAILLILTAALYRIIPGRPFGFEPMTAMALFGGAVIADKKWAFALPLFSMLLSDALYQALHAAGLTSMVGFYDGQWINYLLLAGITFIGIGMKRITVVNVAAAALAAPTIYFLLSNGATWLGHGGYNRPLTFTGMLQAYTDGLPFYYKGLLSCLVFTSALFGAWYALKGARGTKLQPRTA